MTRLSQVPRFRVATQWQARRATPWAAGGAGAAWGPNPAAQALGRCGRGRGWQVGTGSIPADSEPAAERAEPSRGSAGVSLSLRLPVAMPEIGLPGGLGA